MAAITCAEYMKQQRANGRYNISYDEIWDAAIKSVEENGSSHNNARDEICAHYVQFQDCVFFPGDVSCGEKACAVKPRRLSPVA